ncbi:Protein argonaute 2 [Glycine max]|nr:Protein argonaute 2 [Glycine max]
MDGYRHVSPLTIMCSGDEHNFTSDDMKKFIYDTCSTVARCTNATSLAPPIVSEPFIILSHRQVT